MSDRILEILRRLDRGIEFLRPGTPDYLIVKEQLGKEPKARSIVALRCKYMMPLVLLVEPFPGGPNEIFPTIFWLSCPLIHRAISMLEADGFIRVLEREISESPGLGARVVEDQNRYREIAISIARKFLRGKAVRESSIERFSSLYVGGNHRYDRLKCLHAHFAYYLLEPEYLPGKLIREELERRSYVPLFEKVLQVI